GEFNLCRSRSSEAGSSTGRADYGFNDLGRRVPQNERPPRANVIDVLIAVRVPDARALAAHHERRLAAHRAEGPDRRVHPSGDHGLSTLLQAAGLLEGACHQMNGSSGTNPSTTRQNPSSVPPSLCGGFLPPNP